MEVTRSVEVQFVQSFNVRRMHTIAICTGDIADGPDTAVLPGRSTAPLA
jgi:hypothetical protein